MTEHIVHVRARRGINGRTPDLSGSMIDMEQGTSIALTSYEAGQIATVLNGETKLRGERVVYIHQDKTPERTASSSLVDLKTDQASPLNPEDATRIAAIVNEIENIEASDASARTKRLQRTGFKFGKKERTITGKPSDRNLI